MSEAGPLLAPASLADRVRADQVRQLFISGYPMLATLAAAAGLCALFLYEKVLAPWVAAVWLGIMAAHIAVRLVMRGIYRRASDRDRQAKAWARRFTIGAAIGGITWGLGAVAIMPAGRFDLQMLVILTLTAIVYASMAAFGAWFPAFLVFILTSIVPCAVWSALQGDAAHIAFAFLAVVWTPTVILLARAHEAAFVRTLTLQYENAALAEDLRGQKQVAEQASLAKSRFLAAASHDLRQPVHALGMFVGALRSHRLPARSVAIIDHIDASVGAMDGLFTSLLDISKLDAGVVEGRVEPVAVQPLLARILRDLSGEAQGKGLELVQVPTALLVMSDGALLERVLRNLIGNAVRYTDAGRVVVGARRAAKKGVRIEVWDTGPGIAEAEREAIFEEFYQLSNPDRDRTRGLGLGLAIVRRLTAILGHELSFESRPGKGSVFRVSLARAEAAEARPGAPRAGPPAAAAPAVILVVDDEAAIRVGMGELLESWGHRALTAAGGDEAIALLAAEPAPPDLIISDFRLPGEDGIAVIRRLQAACGDPIPAILLTGDTAADRIREAQASGYPLLHKPVPHGRLRAAVANLLRGRRTKTAASA